MDLVNIQNTFLNDVSWLDKSQCNFIFNGGVHIWKVDVEESFSLLDELTRLLQPEEIKRAERYYRETDKKKAIIYRAALRKIIAAYLKCPAQNIKFGLTATNKPFITDQPGINFNISHSGNCLIIAVAQTELGADVEMINNNFNFNEVLDDNFSKDEITFIKEKDSINRFYLVWTRKEAITKASGKGLEEDMKLIPGLSGKQFADKKIVALPGDVIVTSFMADNHHIASIAIVSQLSLPLFFNAPLHNF